MKQVVESYVVLWVIMFMFFFAFAFTSINLNVAQARKIVNDIKTEVQASNGAFVNNAKYEGTDGVLAVTFTTSEDGIKDAKEELTKGNKYYTGNKKLEKVQHFKPDADTQIVNKTLTTDGYTFEYKITTEALINQQYKDQSNETYIYNNIYKIEFYYYYNVPLFGTQCYPIVTFAY